MTPRPALDDWLIKARQLIDPVCEANTCEQPGTWEASQPDTPDTHRVCQTHAQQWFNAGWQVTPR